MEPAFIKVGFLFLQLPLQLKVENEMGLILQTKALLSY